MVDILIAPRPKKAPKWGGCTRPWWRGGHCWHKIREFIEKPTYCSATHSIDGSAPFDELKCCICKKEKDVKWGF